MTRRIHAACLLLLLLGGIASAEVKIKGGKEYAPHSPIILKASDVTSNKASFLWDVEGGASCVEAGETLYVWAAPGEYKVTLTAIDFEAKKVERAKFSFKVTGPTPTPGPGPTPGPTPNPDTPAPIPLAGLRVLIVYESRDATTLPAGQQGLLFGKAFRDLLNASCVTGSDGKTKEWRIWDKDVALDGAEAHWATAMKRTRTSVPWILISNGKTGYEGPLPASVDEATTLIKKYKE